MTLVSPLDVPVLILLGAASAYTYKRRLHDRNRDWMVFLTATATAAFWLDAASSNLLHMKPWLVAPSADVPLAIGVFYVLSYPLWFKWSAGAIFLLLGRTPREGGLLWVFTVRDRTQEFEPAWTDSEEE